MRFRKALQYFGDHIELIQIDGIPGNLRIWLQTRLALFPFLVYRLIDVFQLPTLGVRHDLRPRLIRLSQGHRIRVSRSPIPAQSFIGQLRHVRSAHHHLDARRAQRISHAIGFGDHPRHRPDPYQSDSFFFRVAHQLLLVHRLGVPVHQYHFMSRRRQRLQQKHPQMRHEIPRHAIIRVIE